MDGAFIFCFGDTEFSVQCLGTSTCGKNDFIKENNPNPIKLD